mgnify:CR=1 FL=1
MIDLWDLSVEARGALVNAIPHYKKEGFYKDKNFLDCYQEFNKETNNRYLHLGFDGFRGAVLGMKRKMPNLTYKQNNLETVKKVVTESDYRKLHINTLDEFCKRKWRNSNV